jgi:hypothetical protein
VLRANVSLSRKISRDYNSTGYSIAIDGEVPFSTDDAEGVLEKVGELFNLAQEALDREIGRDQSEDAIGRRDAEPRQPTQPPPSPPPPTPQNNGHTNGLYRGNARATAPLPMNRPAAHNGNGHPDAATPKQLEFVKTMARRFRLNDNQLEHRITEILGRPCHLQQLTKNEAGLVLDNLTSGSVRAGG